MTSTKSRATGEGLRCGGKTAANSKSIRGRKWRATTPRLANSCAVNGSQIATPSPDDTNPHMISDRLVSTRRTRRTSSRLRSEEHTSELQSQSNLVCRLLLEKKKKKKKKKKIITKTHKKKKI